MGAGASIENTQPPTPRGDSAKQEVALPAAATCEQNDDMNLASFSMLQREYKTISKEGLSDEIVFERMKHLCAKVFTSDHSATSKPTPGLMYCRSSDPIRNNMVEKKKREVIFSKGLDDEPRDGSESPIKSSSSDKSEECVDMLKKALQSLLFTETTLEELDKVLAVMQTLKVEPGQNIITQGDSGDKFYVVEHGTLEVIVNGNSAGLLKEGDHFGELALIYEAPRAATIRAVSDALLWTLDRDNFRNIHARSSIDSLAKRAKWLQQVEILGSLSPRQLALLAGVLQAVAFEDGECIIHQGDVGNTFYIVEDGTVVCKYEDIRINSRLNNEVARFGPGDYFGEMALLSDMPRNASVFAEGPVKCLSLGRHEFDSMLGPLSEVLDRNSRIRILKMYPPFATRSNESLERVVADLEIKAYQDGQEIFREGDLATDFYIVKSGCVKVIKKKIDPETGKQKSHEFLLKANDSFGAEVFDVASAKNTYTSSVISCGRSQCHRLQTSAIARSDSVCNVQRISLSAIGLTRKFGSLPFEDIHIAGVLGEGSFGKVVMVYAPVDEKEHVMALKIMAKSHIIASKQQQQVMREKQVLMAIPRHNFIVELYATYQDNNNLYMLMELVQGGELFTLLHNEEFIETVDESTVRFFAANVFLGLEHLHKYDYAYRDLKPENLLISKEGYLKLVDFGFAKKIPFTVKNKDGTEELHSRTYTLCGTLEYLAPEFVLNTGHDLAVDYWALGILIYEMLIGYTPFATEDGDTTQLFRNIALVRTGANQVDFPFHIAESCPMACDLVRRLLQGDPAKRLGVGINGNQQIRQHAWFSEIEWDKLYELQLTPPYVPPINGKYDLSLFDGEQGIRSDDKPFDGKGEEFFIGF